MESLNSDTVVIGLLLILIGVFFGWLFCFGGLLAIIGLVVLVWGLIENEEQKVVVQYYAQPGERNFCPVCGQQVVPGAIRCPSCGRALPAAASVGAQSPQYVPSTLVVCPRCGARNPGFHRYCFVCAFDLRSGMAPTQLSKGEIPIDTLVVCPACGAD